MGKMDLGADGYGAGVGKLDGETGEGWAWWPFLFSAHHQHCLRSCVRMLQQALDPMAMDIKEAAPPNPSSPPGLVAVKDEPATGEQSGSKGSVTRCVMQSTTRQRYVVASSS